jgi:hypothetical protein
MSDQSPSEISRKLFAAVLAVNDSLVGNGYVNRHTGEVRLWSDRRENYEVGGEDLLVDVINDQAAIKANSEDWVRVPKFDDDARAEYGDNVNQFVRDFLAENALPIELS